MSLPILQTHAEPTRQDLIRLFHRTELHYARHLGEERQLDAGTAIANPELPDVHDANSMRDAALPEGAAAAEAVAEVEAHFAAAGSRCRAWVMNPSAAAERTQPLIDHLAAGLGPPPGLRYRAKHTDIMYLKSTPRGPVVEVGGLKIIPARAAYAHTRCLVEEAVSEQYSDKTANQLAEAAMLHLDDPHWEALLALDDRTAVAHIGVLSVGELGRIDDLYVSASHRRRGIGRAMMSRALEICARSLYKHVFLSVAPDNHSAIDLYQQMGFERIGQITAYVADDKVTG